MKGFLGYKLTGLEPKIVMSRLKQIDETLKECGIDCFICIKDVLNWKFQDKDARFLMDAVLNAIKKAELVFLLLNNPDKSEGLLIEAGIAFSLNKKIIILNKKGIDTFFLKGIANEIIEFDNLEDLKKKLKENLFK